MREQEEINQALEKLENYRKREKEAFDQAIGVIFKVQMELESVHSQAVKLLDDSEQALQEDVRQSSTARLLLDSDCPEETLIYTNLYASNAMLSELAFLVSRSSHVEENLLSMMRSELINVRRILQTSRSPHRKLQTPVQFSAFKAHQLIHTLKTQKNVDRHIPLSRTPEINTTRQSDASLGRVSLVINQRESPYQEKKKRQFVIKVKRYEANKKSSVAVHEFLAGESLQLPEESQSVSEMQPPNLADTTRQAVLSGDDSF